MLMSSLCRVRNIRQRVLSVLHRQTHSRYGIELGAPRAGSGPRTQRYSGVNLWDRHTSSVKSIFVTLRTFTANCNRWQITM